MVPLKNAWVVSFCPLISLSPSCVHHCNSPGPLHLIPVFPTKLNEADTTATPKSGASSWTTAQREAFANDVTRPQLWAVTDNVNQSKGDKSPDLWKPPLSSFYCVYARSWTQVKYYYDLTITSAEKTALTSMLNTC